MVTIAAVGQQMQNGAIPEPRLVKAAHEFEAQLMKELLRPMVQSEGIGEDADSGSEGALSDFGAEALGQGLSSRGGLGIADELIRSLSRNGTQPSSPELSGVNPSYATRAGSSKLRLGR